MKKLYLILFMALIFLIPASVKGEEFKLGTKITGEFVTREFNGEVKTKTMQFIRRVRDSKTGYCIEPWNSITDYNLEEVTIDEYLNNFSLTKTQMDRIRLLAYYGYGYENHTSYAWYSATQFLISKTALPKMYIYYTNTLGGTAIQKNTAEITELESLLQKHYKLPSFIDITYPVDSNMTLYDTKKTLSGFEIYEMSKVNAEIVDNSLIVSPLETGNGYVKFIKKDKIYESPTLIYNHDSSQDFMIPGSYEPIYTAVYFNIKGSSLTINQFDIETASTTSFCGESLATGKYELYNLNNELVDTLIVDNYTAVSNDLLNGTYKLVEKDQIDGYMKSEPLTIEIDGNNFVSIPKSCIVNEIELTKKYEDEGLLYPEANVLFEIYQDENKIKEIRTNEEGIAKFSLYYGNYVVKQINSRSGYDKVPDFSINVDNSSKNQNISLINKPLPIPKVVIPVEEKQIQVIEIREENKDLLPKEILAKENEDLENEVISKDKNEEIHLEAVNVLEKESVITNPSTGDDIFVYFIILIIGVFTILIISIAKLHKN